MFGLPYSWQWRLKGCKRLLLVGLFFQAGYGAGALLAKADAAAPSFAPVEYQADTDTSQGQNTLDTNRITNTKEPPDNVSGAFNLLNHDGVQKFWISGQSNAIFQYHPGFHSSYHGPNSFVSTPEQKISLVDSLYLGYQLTHWVNAFYTLERFDGSGLSSGLGMGGLPDLDVVRNPALGGRFYMARLGLHAVIPLTSQTVSADRGPTNLLSKLPAKRIEMTVGKFSSVDFTNFNSVGSDVHKQFMNWAVDNDGSYDYPADTRGYTLGAEIEYKSPNWGVRFLEGMMPRNANGLSLDWDVLNAHSETYEIERHYTFLHGRPGTVRLLGFVNHADMGDYKQAIADFKAGLTPVPEITYTAKQDAEKYGFGFNIEQEIKDGIRVFSRLGWNEGQHETFTYTEVDNTVVLGGAIQGKRWKRPDDKLGLAVATNGISGSHREYLALGGLGFELGDGGLNYGRENIIEIYYTCHLWKGVYVSPDFQLVQNPGYNRDRGPVPVISFRLHIDY